MIGDGCQIKPGCTVKNSIVGLRTKVMANCVIEDCLVMGSDFYETPEDCDTTESCVPMGIGANSCAPLTSRRAGSLRRTAAPLALRCL